METTTKNPAKPITFCIDKKKVTDNFQAYNYWADIVTKIENGKCYHVAITFNYFTLKAQKDKTIFEKVTFKKPVETKQYIIDVLGIKHFEAGDVISDQRISSPVVWLYTTPDDQKLFLLHQPVDKDGTMLLELCDGKFNPFIELQFLDIVSISFEEI